MAGFVYFLKNPITHEVFYIGATRVSIKQRLKSHYRHMREMLLGRRQSNKRLEYLQNLLPLRAEIYLLEVVEDIEHLDDTERMYISIFREWNFNLTNQTDGGTGGESYKHLDDIQKARYRQKLQSALTGKRKPIGFAANLSRNRMGAANPMAGTGKYPPVVCFKNDLPIRMFKNSYEVSLFSGSKSLHGNVIKLLTGRSRRYKPGGYDWKFLGDCDEQVQDIVQRLYESIT